MSMLDPTLLFAFEPTLIPAIDSRPPSAVSFASSANDPCAELFSQFVDDVYIADSTSAIVAPTSSSSSSTSSSYASSFSASQLDEYSSSITAESSPVNESNNLVDCIEALLSLEFPLGNSSAYDPRASARNSGPSSHSPLAPSTTTCRIVDPSGRTTILEYGDGAALGDQIVARYLSEFRLQKKHAASPVGSSPSLPLTSTASALPPAPSTSIAPQIDVDVPGVVDRIEVKSGVIDGMSHIERLRLLRDQRERRVGLGASPSVVDLGADAESSTRDGGAIAMTSWSKTGKNGKRRKIVAASPKKRNHKRGKKRVRNYDEDEDEVTADEDEDDEAEERDDDDEDWVEGMQWRGKGKRMGTRARMTLRNKRNKKR